MAVRWRQGQVWGHQATGYFFQASLHGDAGERAGSWNA
jgi:hypothetical protein